MITVSLMKDYMYCPMKVYIGTDHTGIKSNSIIESRILREAVIGFEEIIKRNLVRLNGELKINAILEELLKDAPDYVLSIIQRYENEINEEISMIIEDLKEDLKFNSLLIAIKTQKMLDMGINGFEIVDILFPKSFIEFKIENRKIGLTAKIDKIEIVDGVYYPIKILTNNPPTKGVWQSDDIQIAAYSFLMEEEFNKKVPVGFVNYIKTGTKKTVLINSMLKEKFENVFNEIYSMIYEGKEPYFTKNINKCRACEFSEICDYSDYKVY
jgi:CRISPR-associated exonuclease Cas4